MGGKSEDLEELKVSACPALTGLVRGYFFAIFAKKNRIIMLFICLPESLHVLACPYLIWGPAPASLRQGAGTQSGIAKRYLMGR